MKVDHNRFLTPRPALLALACLLAIAGCKPRQTDEAEASAGSGPSSLETVAAEFSVHTLALDPWSRPQVLSQPEATPRDWALEELLRDYRATGKTSPQWDAEMRKLFVAFSDYTRISRDNWPQLKYALTTVTASGCDDPMLAYMRVRYREQVTPAEVLASEYLQAALGMAQSQYHPLFKFMAGLRAAQAIRTADTNHLISALLTWTTTQLQDLARDTNAPAEEVFETATLWVNHGGSKEWIDYVRCNLEPVLRANWGETEQWFRFRGRLEIRRAWGDRGSGYAHTVSAEGWQGFREHLALAEEALNTAWQMNSNIAETAYLMMRAELGQGRGRDRMDLWFDRAMMLDTNFYDAVSLMCFYLEPRWYGSHAECLAFARSCVASKEWGGQVPLVLANLHWSLARYYKLKDSPEYWRKPYVWNDVQSSYERFFELNPEAAGWRHDYAKTAFVCGQYKVFLDQLPLFAFGTNYDYFGGESTFRDMIAEASQAIAQGSREGE